MATANPLPDAAPAPTSADASLLVLIAPLPQEQIEGVLAHLTSSFPAEEMVFATADDFARESHPHLRFADFPGAASSWTVAAASFAQAHQLAQENHARAILMLGPEAGTLGQDALRELAGAVMDGRADLAVPLYELPPHAALLNSAIIYPLTRALFASRTRFPLAIDLGLSLRMAQRMATAARPWMQRNQPDALLWPVNEAVAAGFTMQEFDAGPRVLPLPPEPDLNAILPLIVGSLFGDIEVKAAFWQRARPLPPARNPADFAPAPFDGSAEIAPMLQAFRFAYTNLQEIWSLVLPPNSLLGLKRLSLTDEASFRMPESLWARIVFDFLLAYRLRTINRGHLLGALIPLYLGWVASHVNITASGVSPEQHIEAVAAAFEADKPYLVARWRWPDRFNP